MSGKCTSVTGSGHCINKAILCLEVVKLAISVKKFIPVLMDKLK
jgi:hypothetical protein